MTGDHYSLTRLAQQVGLSKGELEHALRLGAVPATALTTTAGGHRKVRDFDAALSALKAYTGQASGPARTKERGTIDYAEARARKEHFGALREEARYLREMGELVERAEVERVVVGQLTVLKDRLLDLPARLGAELAAIEDPHAVHITLEAAIREAIADVRIRIADSDMGAAIHGE
jgi:hypothetical protein